MSRITIAVLAAICLTPIACSAASQEYPVRPIRLIVPFPAGSSSTDILGRGLAQRLARSLGEQLVVDNRPGAGGTVGSDIVAKSAPDGYTLLVGTAGALAVAPSVYAKLPYDPVRDFAPVARFAATPYVMALSSGVPARNVKEFIALARAKSGRLNFGSSGVGGTPHLCGELFKSTVGVDMTHVPYKGGAAVTIALAGGQIDMLCTGLTALKALIDSGKVRGIGMASLQRSALMPDLPTIAEQGVAGFEVSSWSAIVAPAKTPQRIVARLYDEIAKIMKTEDMKNFISMQGSDVVLMPPEEFSAYLKAEIAKSAKVVKAANIQPE
jgi:tripartite-type tricarboxylate transporter receptor subunit TctC